MQRFGVTLRRTIGLLAVAMPLVAGCAGPASKPAEDEAAQFVFYPPLPDEPRLQFLAKFSTVMDVSRGSQGMRSFVFGGEQFEDQLVNKPYGVTIFEGAIYVVDTRGGGYGVFDLAAGRTRFVQGSGAGAMPKPINITIDAQGTRYVTDTQRDAILVFDRNDRFQRVLAGPAPFKPVDVAIIGDRLYVTDTADMQVQVLDKRTGEALFAFSEAGSEPGQLYHPTNLAVGADDTLYVADMTNFRIQQFTPDGQFIRAIGQAGLGFGQFARPKGVAVDREGRIYVVDSAFENVQVLDSDGAPLTFFGGPGSGPGNMNLPTVARIDYENVGYFEKYAAPGFEIEYLVLVASQFGANKVAVFGFGRLEDGSGDAGEGGR